MNLKQFGIRSGGSTAWIWQRITGLVLLAALFLHYLFLHFLNGGVITHGEVAGRLVMPLWKTIDLVFLAAALFHAVQGVMMNIHDYVHRPVARVILVGLTYTVGLILLITGTATVINFQP